MATVLNEQIRVKNQCEREKQLEEEKFLALQTQKSTEWKIEQETVKRKDREKSINLGRLRQHQINELKEKKKKEQEKSRSIELQEILEIRQRLEEEEEHKRQMKVLERERWAKIMVENDKGFKERQLQTEREAALDAKLMADMKTRLDVEQVMRERTYTERLARSETKAKQIVETGTVREKEEQLKLQRKVLREVQAKERAQMEKDRRKREMLHQKKKDIMETNNRMEEEKRQREKETEKIEEDFAAQCRREKEALLAEEEAKRIKKAETQKEYSKDLKSQISEQKAQQPIDDMTRVERSVNKKVNMLSA